MDEKDPAEAITGAGARLDDRQKKSLEDQEIK